MGRDFSAEDGPLCGLRIAIIEDEPLIALDLKFTFEDAGATVSLAHSLAHGLDLAHSLPDVAILDVRLGDKDVYPVADALHRLQVPILFHSGHAKSEGLVGRYPNSVSLPKPAPDTRLVQAVESLAAA